MTFGANTWIGGILVDTGYPSQLSGGQRQRVALARALAIEPRMLLLGEPFGALYAKIRKELRQGLRDIHDTTGLTTIFVTHDQDEAMELADLVVVMRWVGSNRSASRRTSARSPPPPSCASSSRPDVTAGQGHRRMAPPVRERAAWSG